MNKSFSNVDVIGVDPNENKPNDEEFKSESYEDFMCYFMENEKHLVNN